MITPFGCHGRNKKYYSYKVLTARHDGTIFCRRGGTLRRQILQVHSFSMVSQLFSADRFIDLCVQGPDEPNTRAHYSVMVLVVD